MLDYIIWAGLAAVVVALVLGLFNMMRGGPPSRSQALMRWRVLLQFAVIVLVGLAVAFGARG